MAPTLCASSWRRWKARAATSRWMRSASRAIATSRPSCGTPRGSVSPTALAKALRSGTKASHAAIAGSSARSWQTKEEIEAAMTDLRFDAAANTIYQFTWSKFCDWYLELIKGQIDERSGERNPRSRRMDARSDPCHAAPFMPFITEELWQAQGERATTSSPPHGRSAGRSRSKEATDDRLGD